MEMCDTVGGLLLEHSTNPVKFTGLQSGSNKIWAKDFPTKLTITVHTRIGQGAEASAISTTFDSPFFPQLEDDALRMQEPACRPTYRRYQLSSEGDMSLWFDTEVSNIVLAAFARYPSVLQASFERPLGDQHVAQSIDTAYSIEYKRRKFHIAVGDFKRNLIDPKQWQNGDLKRRAQQNLAQELRGYVLPSLHSSGISVLFILKHSKVCLQVSLPSNLLLRWRDSFVTTVQGDYGGRHQTPSVYCRLLGYPTPQPWWRYLTIRLLSIPRPGVSKMSRQLSV